MHYDADLKQEDDRKQIRGGGGRRQKKLDGGGGIRSLTAEKAGRAYQFVVSTVTPVALHQTESPLNPWHPEQVEKPVAERWRR
ncbi:unnamed protein product [Eruca vesicaria subsp. sativa]|uniref:Uncharacterized protein n=1 Tax=Eruca vesicaria subsp. sativa TaxID=29727 RepID=A0ABC8JMZ0_ERUVS|nr:unnamed protein product [Eruca vesicaria subsp. sativa]